MSASPLSALSLSPLLCSLLAAALSAPFKSDEQIAEEETMQTAMHPPRVCAISDLFLRAFLCCVRNSAGCAAEAERRREESGAEG